MYLYRAVDGQVNTVEFYLSRTRGIAAAKAFFRKALKHHRHTASSILSNVNQNSRPNDKENSRFE